MLRVGKWCNLLYFFPESTNEKIFLSKQWIGYVPRLGSTVSDKEQKLPTDLSCYYNSHVDTRHNRAAFWKCPQWVSDTAKFFLDRLCRMI